MSSSTPSSSSTYRSPRDRDIHGRRKTGAAHKHTTPSSALRLLLTALLVVTIICSVALFWAADAPMARCRAWPHGCYPPAAVIVRFDDAPPQIIPEEDRDSDNGGTLDSDSNSDDGSANNGNDGQQKSSSMVTLSGNGVTQSLMASSTKDVGSAASARRCRATLQLRTEIVDVAWMRTLPSSSSLPSLSLSPQSSQQSSMAIMTNHMSRVMNGIPPAGNSHVYDHMRSSVEGVSPTVRSPICDVSRAAVSLTTPKWQSILPFFCKPIVNTSLTVSVVSNVLVNEDYIYTECARFDHGRDACSLPHPSMNYRPKPGPEAKAECAIALFGQHSTNLGYWLLEYFPRLFTLKWDESPLDECLILYRGAWLGHDVGELNIPSLLTELWRIPSQRLWDTGRLGPLRVKRLYVPPAQSCGHVHGPLLSAARHTLMTRNDMYQSGSEWRSSTARRSIVFIDRSAPDVPHQGRALLNRQLLIDTLKRRYSDGVNLDVLMYSRSPSRSHELTGASFANALIIIGVHGAGLSNIIFAAHDDVAMIEIICDWRHYTMYSAAAAAFGFDYYAVAATPSRTGHRREEPDVIVNITNVVSVIDQQLTRLLWPGIDDVINNQLPYAQDEDVKEHESDDSSSSSPPSPSPDSDRTDSVDIMSDPSTNDIVLPMSTKKRASLVSESPPRKHSLHRQHRASSVNDDDTKDGDSDTGAPLPTVLPSPMVRSTSTKHSRITRGHIRS